MRSRPHCEFSHELKGLKRQANGCDPLLCSRNGGSARLHPQERLIVGLGGRAANVLIARPRQPAPAAATPVTCVSRATASGALAPPLPLPVLRERAGVRVHF